MNPIKPLTSSISIYDFTNLKMAENIFLINDVLKLMLLKDNIILIFGSFKFYRNLNIYYVDNKQTVLYDIEHKNKILNNPISSLDIYFIFYTWLKLTNKNKFVINNNFIKDIYYEWVKGVMNE
jgi:hypothetical protein